MWDDIVSEPCDKRVTVTTADEFKSLNKRSIISMLSLPM